MTPPIKDVIVYKGRRLSHLVEGHDGVDDEGSGDVSLVVLSHYRV